MAGRGPNPKANRRNESDVPIRGEYQAAPVGWQHGQIPKPPDGLMEQSRIAWKAWFSAWYAGHWTPDDLPQLQILVLLYDQVIRGEYQRASEFRLLADTLGITPKGAQDRRWVRAIADRAPKSKAASQYGHLRAVK